MPTKDTRSEYAIELTACFTFTISTELEGRPGLDRNAIEEMIEADWMWISADTDVLLESTWQLESFEERPMPGGLR